MSQPTRPVRNRTVDLRVLVVILGIGVMALGSALASVLLLGPDSRPAPCTTEALSPSASVPLVVFSPVAISGGNATFSIVAAVACPPPTAYRFNLGFEGQGGPAASLAPSGQDVSTAVSNTTFRVHWTDRDGQGVVNVGDTFTVAGDQEALPAGADFTFYLYWLDMTLINTANWRT